MSNDHYKNLDSDELRMLFMGYTQKLSHFINHENTENFSLEINDCCEKIIKLTELYINEINS